ncbi:MAG: rRNA maturation RNase YbeY [Syntrophaceae bacterium]|nr:rRNA maturation RNase YbeY [Deltaproteobacteria bacterium]
MNTVDVQNEQEVLPIDAGVIEEWAHRILEILGRDGIELSVVLIDNARIRELNREYLGRDNPTNVISFPQQEGEAVVGSHLGDVVISVEKAFEEASDAGIDPQGRIRQLLVHGICHLTGYNHEDVPEDKALEMEAAEEWVLSLLEAPAPG